MKLYYRGVSYQSGSTNLEDAEVEIDGKPWKLNYSSCYVRHIPVPPLAANPIVRGFAAGSAQPTAAQAVAKPNDKALPACKNGQKVLDETARTHQENIRRNLAQRLKAAKAKGDRHLLSLLLAESKQIAFGA